MPVCLSKLKHGQQLVVKGDPSSLYYGHKCVFEGVSIFFDSEVAIVNFYEPKPLNHAGDIVESDLLFPYEIEMVEDSNLRLCTKSVKCVILI